MRVLAVGATGKFAGLVVPALVSKGLQVRALMHDPAKADRVVFSGVYHPSLVNHASMLAARNGLSAMFADYTAHGFHGGNNLVLRTVLGRAPRAPDSFFGELAA